jgi:transcriptional regulator with XRE-family HTH domain
VWYKLSISISERIKEGLEIRNMKQSELVEKTGIGKSSISTYLTGAYEPKQRNIYKIAKALDVSEAWLMGLDVPMERTPHYIRSLELNNDEFELLENYRKLNDLGKKEASKRVDELTHISKYAVNKNNETSNQALSLEEAREYLKSFSSAAYGGFNPDEMTDEQIIETATELKYQFETVTHKYKK